MTARRDDLFPWSEKRLQNLIDLKYLRGIDLAILPIDVLDYAREKKVIVTDGPRHYYYITKLYNEEFHLLARATSRLITDLANRKAKYRPAWQRYGNHGRPPFRAT